MTAENVGDQPLGYFDAARMEETYGFVEDSFDIESFDVTGAYTNRFLNEDVTMPAQ
jgi:hypothetical protein